MSEMKKQLVMFIICIMLLIMIFSPHIVSLENFQVNENGSIPQTSDSDSSNTVPLWQIDDDWVYMLHYQERLDQNTQINFRVNDFHIKIKEVFEESYYGLIWGNITGDMITVSLPIVLDDVAFQGNFICDKATLGISRWFMHFETQKKIGPINIPLDVQISIHSTPEFDYFDFPLTVGSQWTTPSAIIDIMIVSSSWGNPEMTLFHKQFTISPKPLICTNMEDIQIRAGIYRSYNISDNLGFHHSYYSSQVKNFVKLDVENPLTAKILEMELISTSVDATEQLPQPLPPVGPTEGDKGVRYIFCISQITDKFDVLFYRFDWGDKTESEWLGPFEPDEEICDEHIWTNNGTYDVKVKVKNEEGLESIWSNPLSIRIGEAIDDDNPPTVRIIRPSDFQVYLNDNQIGSFPMILVFGFVNVYVDAYDEESYIDRVEFFVNGIQKGVDSTEPYTYYFDEPPGRSTLTVWGYDQAGNKNSDSVSIITIF